MISRFLEKHSDDIRKIGRNHGATRIRIFGSYAIGTASSSSDIDLLVDLEEGRDLIDLVGFKQDLESLLGCKVDVLTEGALSPYLPDRIIGEARPL